MQNSIFTMPTLPTELIIEILSRLPVKYLLQFKSVSKSWLALISSPEFIKTHLTLSAKNKDYTHHRVVLTHIANYVSPRKRQCILRDYSLSSFPNNDSVIEAFDLDYPMNKPRQHVSIVGSVNGLICLAIKENGLFLWNPSIRKFKKLADSRLRVSGGYDSTNGVVYGFGYDELNDDYKIVGVLCIEKDDILHHVEVEIYSLKSDSWIRKYDIPEGVQLIKPCKFVNGKVHWVNDINNGGFHAERDIISIDLADEKWGKMEQPRYGEGDFSLMLEVLGSGLSMYCNYNMTSHADVWVMREYGVKESWTKMYTIGYPGYWFSPFISQALCMSNKGDVLLVPGYS